MRHLIYSIFCTFYSLLCSTLVSHHFHSNVFLSCWMLLPNQKLKKKNKKKTISTNFYQSLSQYVVLSNYSCCVETVLNLTPLQHHKYMNTFTTVPHSLFKYKCFINLFTTPRYSSNTNMIGVKHQSIYLFITFYSPPLFNKWRDCIQNNDSDNWKRNY
jgi:hypothetical protein